MVSQGVVVNQRCIEWAGDRLCREDRSYRDREGDGRAYAH
jgi:hypothetical protein